MTDNTASSARINFKQAIIVALITSITTISVTLISTKGSSPSVQSNISDCSSCENEINKLKVELDNTISAENLSDISSRFFKKQDKKQELKDSLKIVVSMAENHLEEKKHYAYDFFSLKKILISKPKGNINTRIDDGDDISTFIIIQKILKNIQFYTGPLTGDRLETKLALMKFQEKQNSITNNYINEDDYGILGNQTYIALLEQFKHSN